MLIHILNKIHFEIMLVQKNLDKDTIDLRKDLCFISILNKSQTPVLNNTPNCLVLHFDDITDKDTELISNKDAILFSEEHAEKIISFCEQNKDRKEMFIHCFAGQSRSGAVGVFINDIWGEESFADLKIRHPWIYPNPYVSMILNQTYRKELDKIKQ